MNYFRGTKGPWQFNEDTTKITSVSSGIEIANTDNTYCEYGENKSNTQLIVAAPDLIQCLTMGSTLQTPEFLQWIADRLVHVHGEDANYDFIHSLRDRASAMAKARDKALLG